LTFAPVIGDDGGVDHSSRQLTRSETDKRIAGVCGGIADYFDIDPVLVRIAFVVAALAGGGGFIAYIVLWIALPKGHPSSLEEMPPRHGARRPFGRSVAAIRIAEERYARGEINAEQLDQIRTDLAGGY